jgi:uncharacterized metal-binding protein
MENPSQACSHSCVDCGFLKCCTEKGTYPDFCLTTPLLDEAHKKELMSLYDQPENHEVMVNAALVEYEGYGRLTRVEETMLFAKKMGFHRLGIATCGGLIQESRMLARILRANGFEVYSVICKAGAIKKTEVGIDEKCNAVGEQMCNPIYQAMALNLAKTELNIVMGLCVGHDSLFYRYIEGLTTTMVVKDRATGHNPVAPIYGARGYFRSRLFPGENSGSGPVDL